MWFFILFGSKHFVLDFFVAQMMWSLKFEFSEEQIHCYIVAFIQISIVSSWKSSVHLGQIVCFWHAVCHDVGTRSRHTAQKLEAWPFPPSMVPHPPCSQSILLDLGTIYFILNWEPIIRCRQGVLRVPQRTKDLFNIVKYLAWRYNTLKSPENKLFLTFLHSWYKVSWRIRTWCRERK
jgi:hypothetical protein